MSQQFVPPTQAPLIDGRVLRVEEDGVHLGERFHPLAQIEEARLLFLRPETIGLRLARVGLAEYSFARPGDGVAALETLYYLRPELRRVDAPAPVAEAPAGYFAPIATPPPLPPPPQAAPSPYAPTQPGTPFGAPARSDFPMAPQFARPAGSVPFPAQTLEAYGAEPNRTHAGLTPVPRTASQLIGATFRLFGKRLAPLIMLALLVAALPSMALALLDAILSALSGVNPLAGAPNPINSLQQAVNGQTTSITTTTTTAATSVDALIGLLSLVVVVLTLLVAAWSQAALTVGARQALLGRPISPRDCAREGFARVWPTLWALFFLYGMLALIAVPGLGLALTFVLAPYTPGISNQISPEAGAAFTVIACILAVAVLALVAYLWTRFALYPTAAALGMPQPLRLSLTLTSFGWWRAFRALFVVTLMTGLLIIPAGAAQLLSVAVATVALAPLAQLITGPLGALIRVSVLYDQRLRREGYALFVQEGVAIPPSEPSSPASESPTGVSR
ncbi:MAG TPA: hypothetical protein VE338_12185 [Ktedonobacterales bacterium]|nr:hypothetical protein [Ktedonobacterales bacterium]